MQYPHNGSRAFDLDADPVIEDLQTALVSLAHEQAFSRAAGRSAEPSLHITTVQELWEVDDPRSGIHIQINGRAYRLVVEPRGIPSPANSSGQHLAE